MSAAHYVTLRISDHRRWRDRPTAGVPSSLTLDSCTTCDGETRILNTWVFEAELDGADVKLFANFQVLDKLVEVTLRWTYSRGTGTSSGTTEHESAERSLEVSFSLPSFYTS